MSEEYVISINPCLAKTCSTVFRFGSIYFHGGINIVKFLIQLNLVYLNNLLHSFTAHT